MSDFQLSVIVPFYKRDDYAIEIIKLIRTQAIECSIKTELLFVDAESRVYLDDYLVRENESKYFVCKIYDTVGYVSNKRNLGIKKAKSENIIIMDDDCTPEKDFLKSHLKSLEASNNKSVFCGMVYYRKELIKQSNYFKFREKRHRIYDNDYLENNRINFHHVVTMNMSFKKKLITENKVFFDETHNEYGYEDIQFGLDLLSKNIELKTTKASVIHQDSTPLFLYYKKLKSFFKNYYILFYNKNKKYFNLNKDSKNIISNDIQKYKTLVKVCKLNDYFNNKLFVMKRLLQLLLIFVIPLRIILIQYLTLTDKFYFFYSFKIFKLIIYFSLLEAFLDKQELKGKWI